MHERSLITNVSIWLLWIILTVLMVGGVASVGFMEEKPKNTDWAAPTMLVIAAILVLIYFGIRSSAGLLIGGFIGFLSELVGVSTGYPYGSYQYTEVLGLSIGNVPIVLFAAWIIVLSLVCMILKLLGADTKVSIILAPILLVLLDLAIEPVATGSLGAWYWTEEIKGYYGVPISNFGGWLLVGFVAYLPVQFVCGKYTVAGIFPGASIFCFFVAINLLDTQWIGAIAGISSLSIAIASLAYSKKNCLVRLRSK